MSKISKVCYKNTDNILYGWDNKHYSDIFVHKFHPHPQGETPNSIYYSMYDFINERGFLLSSKRRKRHYYVNTTVSQSWQPKNFPKLFRKGNFELIYSRYEIRVEGGISTAMTLGEKLYSICSLGRYLCKTYTPIK